MGALNVTVAMIAVIYSVNPSIHLAIATTPSYPPPALRGPAAQSLKASRVGQYAISAITAAR